MLKLSWIIWFAPWLCGACTATTGACSNPVHDACTDRAQTASVELSKIAAQRNTTPDDMTSQYVNACEGQLQHDLDQTLTDLQAIANADGGAAQ